MTNIVLGEINSIVGDLQYNAQLINNIIQQASDNSLIVFPELAICGYPPQDLLIYKSFVEECLNIITTAILPYTKNKAVLIGCPIIENQKLYNSALFIKDGKIQQIIHKKFLPNNEIFFESRYFDSGLNINNQDNDNYLIEYNNQNFAVFICEDLLGSHELPCFPDKHLNGIICLSASPYRKNHKELRQQRFIHAYNLYKCPVYFVNQIGANDGIIFDGNSCITNSNSQNQYINSSIIKIQDALILGIQDYIYKNKFKQIILGLSGGIDSAVVTALAVRALGANNVKVLLMPSEYSSEHSISDSMELINNLNIQYELININNLKSQYLEALNIHESGIVEENLQARIRGVLLMAKSNQDNRLLLATSNKSELAIGYTTLYGDSCGALAPIADLWKTQVYELAKTLPEIPQNILTKEPSAELRPDQKDSDNLPEYNILDNILKLHIESKYSIEQIQQKTNYELSLIHRIIRLYKLNEYKRNQYAVILKTSYQSFGDDWKMPITKFLE